jgi:hypothetical protein
MFLAVRTASAPVIMFCAPKLIFDGTECVGSRFHVFSPTDSISTVPRASGPVFMFCVPRFIFDETEGVGSGFHVLRYGLVFGVTKGVGSHFHVLRSQTCLWRCGGRRLPLSCFTLPDSFSAVPSVSGLVFMFCAHRLNFDGTEGVGSRFHVLRAQIYF